jgi:hypothetical protein
VMPFADGGDASFGAGNWRPLHTGATNCSVR